MMRGEDQDWFDSLRQEAWSLSRLLRNLVWAVRGIHGDPLKQAKDARDILLRKGYVSDYEIDGGPLGCASRKKMDRRRVKQDEASSSD